MGFAQKVSTAARRHISNLREAHKRYVANTEAREEARLTRAKSASEREVVRLRFKREKLLAEKELVEAQIATAKAVTALKKAKGESGDVGGGMIGRAWRTLVPGKSRRRTTRRRSHR